MMKPGSVSFLLLCVCIGAALAVAGCTNAPAPGAATTAATPAVTLSSLALGPSDVPAGYTLTAAREKNATDVSQLALDLGWQAGYVVQYTNGSARQGTIVQSIARYPAGSIPDVIGLVGKQEKNNAAMDYADIASFSLGDVSGGFTGKMKAGGIAIPTTPGNNPITSGALVNSASQDLPGQDFAEVYFAKGTIFEVIRVTAPGADTATAEALARTAYSKIP